MSKTPTPLYTHDCDLCRYLGTVERIQWYDLYVCERSPDAGSRSLVARYGDDGPDYTSMPASLVKTLAHNSVLTAAFNLVD